LLSEGVTGHGFTLQSLSCLLMQIDFLLDSSNCQIKLFLCLRVFCIDLFNLCSM
jgi:hypothetical protein